MRLEEEEEDDAADADARELSAFCDPTPMD